MTGHRRARTWRLDIEPPPGETWRVEVDKDRKVAGEVLFKNGHMERPCLRRASMIAVANSSFVMKCLKTDCEKSLTMMGDGSAECKIS